MLSKSTTFIFFWIALVLASLTACQPSATTPEPTPTLQAALENNPILADTDLNLVSLLLDRPYGKDRLLLYSWQDEAFKLCLGASYLTPLNQEWQSHDTYTSPCSNGRFLAAYSGNSQVESPFGPARHTIVYGVSEVGQAVRVVWSDGQVSHIPLEDEAFVEARNGRFKVERLELLDEHHNVLLTEDWAQHTAYSN